MVAGFIPTFLSVSIILLLGFFSHELFKKKKIPESIILIIFGVIIANYIKIMPRENIINWLPLFSNIALMVILFDLGLSLEIFEVIRNITKAVIISLAYFFFSSMFTTMVAVLVFKLDILIAILLGFTLGSISSAASYPLFSTIKEEDIKTVFYLDSTFSDVFVVVSTLILLQMISIGRTISLTEALHDVVSRFSIGVLFGLVGGFSWIRALKYLYKRQYGYMMTIAFLLLLYAVTELVRGSGAIASLMFGLVLANARELAEMLKMERPKLKSIIFYFHDEITFFIRSFFYVLLGVLFSPHFLNLQFVLGVVLICLLMIVARYLAIYPICRKDSLKYAFIIPRGEGAAVIATLYFQFNVPNAPFLFSIVTSSIFLSNIVSIFVPILGSKKKEEGIVLIE